MRTEDQREKRRQYRQQPHVKEAEARAAKKRFTKRLAKHGESMRSKARERYAANVEKERERARNRPKIDPEAVAAIRKRYRSKHAVKIKADSLRRYKTFRAALDEFKIERGCVDCGYRGHPAALDFDHVRGVKAREVSLCGSIKAAMLEAAKCDIRCANCHRIKTFERRVGRVP